MTITTGTPLTLTDVTTSASAADSCAPASTTAALSPVAAAQLAVALKAVADPLRLRMLSYLVQTEAGEACVCDLAELADVSQPTVSHHLKVLRDAGILTAERRGTWVWYAIAPDYAAAILALLDAFPLLVNNSPMPDQGDRP